MDDPTRSRTVLVMTANLGSLFDEDTMELQWFNSFEEVMELRKPVVVALHLQEVGGKDYEVSMPKVDTFVSHLMSLKCMTFLNRLRGYLDKDFKSSDHFTALGSLYFFHSDLPEVEIWDCNEGRFLPLLNDAIVTSCDAVNTDHTFVKQKFPTDFFPGVKWSRKGFLATKWRIGKNIMHFVNIHLFHDESNFVAMEKSPSEYSSYRKTALSHVLNRLKDLVKGDEALFLYGDFNFRLDLQAVIKHLTDGHCSQHIRSDSGEYSRIVYRNSSEDVLTIEKKGFFISCDSPFTRNYVELFPFDNELKQFQHLKELPVSFQPSYPFSEEIGEGCLYLPKRCPAWCDRILMNDAAARLIEKNPTDVSYSMMGKDVCVGDHKPIYLTFSLNQVDSSRPEQSNAMEIGKTPPSNE
ncbi:inositol polyphosphate-5-phosphatase A-like [Dysidea avara]|uniref:inositol polyphosphate-5-phosphatase A-like n=1 Tax=Dysidea avara TaxID=196820 RepID=UPI00332C8F1A